MSGGTGLRKPVFGKVKDLETGSRGVNLKVKVVSTEMKLEREKNGTKLRIGEAIAGDDTGIVTLTLRNEQIDVCAVGAPIVIRNGKVEMFKGHIRLEVDKWGKIVASEEALEFEVNKENDVSATEYELVPVDER
uniref:Single-stranded DNA binding protein Ssb-like OB fold domain-containing protein n=1 Tax=Chromera velia CCMP2878 TaxID=1169474 RepID=A0A0G4GFD3_9ALVE|mmetsp:Transcript_52865/g.103379  ORF Transcript_52865/g.103379 Transcript_52865/m.103379 type:complete len:134 (+) Transcript_52865:261-662(+)|eukprot:Cvel_21657.t1-p1 / transcript=Cvel_21657.t1 / gene=Cvel_21657 / organism=Chromera_velia_CCMP2878 / gene_product=Uncharacterized protein At4g28440, putative / transcript_product=Uncharacterized protein At4g28440, putative / location=Cvel_scaffold2049:4215-4613(+) / protein_length=133 / sequence_SO=supercontig / SO=protein_coding / is_pseudo=false